MLVPTMYAVAHGGGRRFISEYYNQMTLDANGRPVAKRLLNISTIPHRSNTLSSVLKYMTPTVYGETLFETNILSPFHYKNRRYYKYAVTNYHSAKHKSTYIHVSKTPKLLKHVPLLIPKTER